MTGDRGSCWAVPAVLISLLCFQCAHSRIMALLIVKVAGRRSGWNGWVLLDWCNHSLENGVAGDRRSC